MTVDNMWKEYEISDSREFNFDHFKKFAKNTLNTEDEAKLPGLFTQLDVNLNGTVTK